MAGPTQDEAWYWPRAAYIHVPFCAHKCGYCDFASVAGEDHLADRYLDALTAEIATLGTSQAVRTIFVGGGTPTRLEPQQLERLLGELRRWLPLESGGEFTVEANPETVNAEKVRVLAEAGVTRVSLGAQSSRPRLLATLERNHAPASVGRAVDLIRHRIEN